MKCRLLIIEQRLLREGIRAVLPEGFEVVAEASTGQEALAILHRTGPGMAVLGIPPADMSGVVLLPKLLRELPQLRVLALSAVDAPDTIAGLLRAGCAGLVLKSADPEVFRCALLSVAAGSFYLCPRAAARMAEFIQRGSHDPISARERQVLEGISAGHGNKQIAVTLGLQIQTVGSYRKTLMRKLGAQNVAALLRAADRQGLLSAETRADE